MGKKIFDIYLGQPYSHADPYVRVARYLAGIKASAWLLDRGINVFSPIVHSHPISVILDRPHTWIDFWHQFDSRIIPGCRALLILSLPGFEDSIGLREEISLAKEHELAIGYMKPIEGGYSVTGLEELFGQLS